jgi:hypothetical protein
LFAADRLQQETGVRFVVSGTEPVTTPYITALDIRAFAKSAATAGERYTAQWRFIVQSVQGGTQPLLRFGVEIDLTVKNAAESLEPMDVDGGALTYVDTALQSLTEASRNTKLKNLLTGKSS